MSTNYLGLAIDGGNPVISKTFSMVNPIKDEEISAANDVLKSGKLSGFLGAKSEQFLGGLNVKKFEASASTVFGGGHCVSFNSWTSGLEAAVGALPDLEIGDEVITTPWTMTATASAILVNGAVPVFADIDPISFCLDPASVESLITSRTRAILTVDIFGRSSDYLQLREICEKYKLWLIGDCAQSPGTLFKGKHVATLSDVGGYSLNYHKHLHSGEGGFALTNNDLVAERLQLIRNHSEAVVQAGGPNTTLLGHNFRLGEIEAAIADVQVNRLDELIESKISNAEYLTDCLAPVDEIITPEKLGYHENVYYIYPILLRNPSNGLRDFFVEALRAEGVPALVSNYQNIHRLPIYEAFKQGNQGRFSHLDFSETALNSYGEGSLPVAEKYFDKSFFGLHMCSFDFSQNEIEQIAIAIDKVAKKIRG